MKKIIISGCLLFICINVYAKPVRVFYKDDGKISVVYPVKKLHTPDYLKGIPHKDMDSAELPQTRENRDKWRWNLKDKIIYIDNTIVTKKELIEEKENLLDAKLAKDVPDLISIIRLYRDLEKLKQKK